MWDSESTQGRLFLIWTTDTLDQAELPSEVVRNLKHLLIKFNWFICSTRIGWSIHIVTQAPIDE